MDELIRRLGGPTEVARELGIKRSRVNNWRDRGVPWRLRPKVARLAKQKGVALPKDFIEEAAA